MNVKTKRRVVTVLSLALMTTFALFCATLLPKNASKTKAETAVTAPQNVTADALGFLRWDEVDGATGYEWSYSTDGASYITGGECTGTEADVSVAINEAVEAAQAKSATSATLKLQVKALPDGEPTVIDYYDNTLDKNYNKPFDKYINFGYTQHDIADVYAPVAAEGGVGGAIKAHSALYMNELMTFGVSFSGNASGEYYRIGIFSHGGIALTDPYYGFTIKPDGSVVSNRQNTAVWTYTTAFPAMTVGETSYFSVGAFDTYSVADDTWIGETYYLSRTDIVDGKPVVVGTVSRFFDTRRTTSSGMYFHLPSDRPAHLLDAKNHTVVNNATTADADGNYTGTVPKDSFVVLGNNGATLKSGRISATSATVSAPTQVFYDNVTGQVRWNRVENATAYEWSCAGNNAWETVEKDYIPAEKVAAAIQAAKANGMENVRFAVRAVNGSNKSQTQYCALDLTAFYGASSTLKDISDLNASLKNPATPLSTIYSYHNTGYDVNTFAENSFVFNVNDSNANRLMIALHANAWGKTTGYVFSIYSNGIITVAKNSTQGNGDNNYWFRPSAMTFELGKKYVATCGVEALVDEAGNKIADRLTMRISDIEEDGYRKVLTNLSYDNYEYDWEGVKIGSYTTISNYLLSGTGTFTSTTEISCVNSTYAYEVTPTVNGRAITANTQTVTYGAEYDFTEAAKVAGYDLTDAKWTYTLNGEEKDFYLKGNWIIPFADGVGTFNTTATPIDYTINYVMPEGISGVTNSNPTQYNVESEIILADPQNVPTGYVFKGWYKDQAYTQAITSIKESTDDLTLYAKIEGYSVTINNKDGNEVSKEASENGQYVLPAYSQSGVIGYNVDGDLYKSGDTIGVTKDMVIEEVWLNFHMVDGAKVRLTNADNYYGGLRFTINADSETMAAYADIIKVYGMIAPTDGITDGNFDGVGEEFSAEELTKYSTEDGVNVYNVTLTEVLYTNYNRAFSARGYLVIQYASGEAKVYTDYNKDVNSRSVYQVACMASNDGEVGDGDKEILANYLSYTVNLVKDGDTYSVATVEQDGLQANVRMYTVSEGTLTLTDLPARLVSTLQTRPYVPVTVYEGTSCTRTLVKVTLDGTSATASLN